MTNTERLEQKIDNLTREVAELKGMVQMLVSGQAPQIDMSRVNKITELDPIRRDDPRWRTTSP